MSDLPSLQVFINTLDEHLSKMSTLPGRSKDTEESHFFREIIHILTSQWIKHWFEGRRAEKLFWLSSLFHRASGQPRRSPSPPARGRPDLPRRSGLPGRPAPLRARAGRHVGRPAGSERSANLGPWQSAKLPLRTRENNSY